MNNLITRYKYVDEGRQHLHTLDGKPLVGTSTALKVIAKPLTWYASGKACETLGWKNNKIRTTVGGKIRYTAVPQEERRFTASAMLEKIRKMSVDEYIELLDTAYAAHDTYKKERAGAGTDMHAELEKYVKLCLNDNGGVPVAPDDVRLEPFGENKYVMSFSKWAMKEVEVFLWSEMHCYSEVHWLGGITDWGCLLKNGVICTGDFKSSKEAYVDQFLQDGLYSIQIAENGGYTADGKIIFPPEKRIAAHAVVPFGSETGEPVVRFDTEEAQKAALYALGLYKYIQMYEASLK